MEYKVLLLNLQMEQGWTADVIDTKRWEFKIILIYLEKSSKMGGMQ